MMAKSAKKHPEPFFTSPAELEPLVAKMFEIAEVKKRSDELGEQLYDLVEKALIRNGMEPNEENGAMITEIVAKLAFANADSPPEPK